MFILTSFFIALSYMLIPGNTGNKSEIFVQTMLFSLCYLTIVGLIASYLFPMRPQYSSRGKAIGSAVIIGITTFGFAPFLYGCEHLFPLSHSTHAMIGGSRILLHCIIAGTLALITGLGYYIAHTKYRKAAAENSHEATLDREKNKHSSNFIKKLLITTGLYLGALAIGIGLTISAYILFFTQKNIAKEIGKVFQTVLFSPTAISLYISLYILMLFIMNFTLTFRIKPISISEISPLPANAASSPPSLHVKQVKKKESKEKNPFRRTVISPKNK